MQGGVRPWWAQGHHLRMWAARLLGVTTAQHLPVRPGQHTTDAGVRIGQAEAQFGQCQRVGHVHSI
jgi:hypothetical protein